MKKLLFFAVIFGMTSCKSTTIHSFRLLENGDLRIRVDDELIKTSVSCFGAERILSNESLREEAIYGSPYRCNVFVDVPMELSDPNEVINIVLVIEEAEIAVSQLPELAIFIDPDSPNDPAIWRYRISIDNIQLEEKERGDALKIKIELLIEDLAFSAEHFFHIEEESRTGNRMFWGWMGI